MKRHPIFIVGVLLICGAAFIGVKKYFFVKNSLVASGVVREMVVVKSRRVDSSRRSGGGTTYAPKVEFKAADGSAYVFKSSVSQNPPAYKKGDSVNVIYNPDNPHKAEINSLMSIWGLVIIMSFLGSGLCLFLFLSSRKAEDTERRARVERYGA